MNIDGSLATGATSSSSGEWGGFAGPSPYGSMECITDPAPTMQSSLRENTGCLAGLWHGLRWLWERICTLFARLCREREHIPTAGCGLVMAQFCCSCAEDTVLFCGTYDPQAKINACEQVRLSLLVADAIPVRRKKDAGDGKDGIGLCIPSLPRVTTAQPLLSIHEKIRRDTQHMERSLCIVQRACQNGVPSETMLHRVQPFPILSWEEQIILGHLQSCVREAYVVARGHIDVVFMMLFGAHWGEEAAWSRMFESSVGWLTGFAYLKEAIQKHRTALGGVGCMLPASQVRRLLCQVRLCYASVVTLLQERTNFFYIVCRWAVCQLAQYVEAREETREVFLSTVTMFLDSLCRFGGSVSTIVAAVGAQWTALHMRYEDLPGGRQHMVHPDEKTLWVALSALCCSYQLTQDVERILQPGSVQSSLYVSRFGIRDPVQKRSA